MEDRQGAGAAGPLSLETLRSLLKLRGARAVAQKPWMVCPIPAP